jgi:hypothetical protein
MYRWTDELKEVRTGGQTNRKKRIESEQMELGMNRLYGRLTEKFRESNRQKWTEGRTKRHTEKDTENYR